MGTGVGRYQALHGLIIDHLLSARVVTADGDLVTASETENADLFWALRGAGTGFGVVTEATFRIHDQTHDGQVQSADLIFPLSAAEQFYDALQEIDHTMPAELMITTLVGFDPHMNTVCRRSLGQEDRTDICRRQSS